MVSQVEAVYDELLVRSGTTARMHAARPTVRRSARTAARSPGERAVLEVPPN
jgi:hypothetical protein